MLLNKAAEAISRKCYKSLTQNALTIFMVDFIYIAMIMKT